MNWLSDIGVARYLVDFQLFTIGVQTKNNRNKKSEQKKNCSSHMDL